MVSRNGPNGALVIKRVAKGNRNAIERADTLMLSTEEKNAKVLDLKSKNAQQMFLVVS